MQTQILALLHQADALAPSFRASHDNAARLAASVNASSMQISNLEQLISRNPQPNSIRDRTLVKLQQAIEESLYGIRQELVKMEACVEQLKGLLFQVDLFFSDPQSAMQFAGNGQEALRHVDNLYHSYQGELLEKRELLSSYTCEEVTAAEFATQWKRTDVLQMGQDDMMDDLLKGMNSFG